MILFFYHCLNLSDNSNLTERLSFKKEKEYFEKAKNVDLTIMKKDLNNDKRTISLINE
jgi:hypothetical protein